MPLTNRDTEICRTLARSLRVLSIEQVAQTWFGACAEPKANARKRIRTLGQSGLLTNQTVMAHPEIKPDGPIVSWTPFATAETPDFGAASWKLQKRWCKPVRKTLLVQASAKANRIFGGHAGNRRMRNTEVDHDLLLATVFLKIRSEQPARCKAWRHESELLATGSNRQGRLRPDAMLGETIIECGGAYARKKLEAFHLAFRHMPYQIW